MSAETPGADRDDTEALATLLYEHRPRPWRSFTNDNTVLDCCGQTFGNATKKGRRGDEERAWKTHAAHVAEVVLATYVARQVEPIERERDAALASYGRMQARADELLARALRAERERDEWEAVAHDGAFQQARAETAERERDEAREERDYHQARADVLLAKMSGRVALRGGKPGDYWREWHLSHCGAAQAAATAEQQRDEAQAEASDVGHDYDRRGERLWRLAALAGWTPGNESDNDATAEAYVTEALTEARAVIERVTALLGEWTCGNCGERAAVRVVVARILTAREAAAERRGAVNALRTIATQIDIEIPTMRSDHVLPYDRLATWLRERADRIEAGDD